MGRHEETASAAMRPGIERRATAHRFAAAVVAMCLSLPAFGARAQESETTANVVALDANDVVVDLPLSKGASPGVEIELWRPLKLKHPVTGKVLMDRFRIGTLRVTQAGPTLSLAAPAGALQRAPAPGDVVILRAAPQVARPAGATPAGSAGPAQAAAPAPCSTDSDHQDPESKVLSDMFDSLRGSGLVPRIQAYESYVRASPQGRYARVLWEEARELRRLVATDSDHEETEPYSVRFTAPERALAGLPLSIGVEVAGTSGTVLHIRRAGEPSYSSIPMQQASGSYFTAVVAAGQMKAPGQEYFIEAVKKNGSVVPIVGAADRPRTLTVDAPRASPEIQPRSYAAAIWTDYADYNRLRGNDRAWQTEGYFGMRFGDVGVRAVRSGFGVYRGAGGSLRDLDELGKEPRATGLTYGYLEGEFGASDFVSFVGRGVVGVKDDGRSGGAQLLLRIGNDRRTNLLIGGEVLGGVGLRSITQLQLASFARVPILLRTEVTNQPAGTRAAEPVGVKDGIAPEALSTDTADIGARAIVQVGYRFTPELTVSLRGSYQGRTIRHAGPGVGAGVTYEW